MLHKRLLWSGLAGTWVGLAGCNGLTKIQPDMTAPTPVAATAGKEELPPEQAARVCLAVAQNLDKSGNEVGAIEQYEKVLKLEAGNLHAARRLAVLYDRRCEFAKADALYAKVAKARPKDADLHNDMGYSHYQRQEWAEAEKHLRKALELDAKHSRARCNLGLVLGQQQRYDEARECFRAVVGEADSHCNLAFVYWTQGKIDEARRECQLAEKADGTNVKAKEILAQLDRRGEAPAGRGDEPARPGQGRRDRELELAHALKQMNKPEAGEVCTADCKTPAGQPEAAEVVRPVYRSPNGTAWVPVKPKADVQPAGPVGGTPATITWDE
jgi:Flp pilus assembly protein TadD